MVLFGLQFTVALVAYALIARWYVWPRLVELPVAAALIPLLWVHVFRIAGGAILAPGSVGPGVPMQFREMVGYGDMLTALLALVAVIMLRYRIAGAIAFVWVFLVVATLDTLNAIVQSMRFSVFDFSLGVNWTIVTVYVPALLVTSLMMLLLLLGRGREQDVS